MLRDIARVFVLLSFVWAVAALVVQVTAARGGGRREHSERAGSPQKGVLHNFTVAMLPWHKETVKDHPGKFVAGVIMHLGVVLTLLDAAAVLVRPTAAAPGTSPYLCVLVAGALACGAYLFLRRLWSRDLHVMSAAEDYMANLVTCGLLAISLLHSFDSQYRAIFLIYVALFLALLPFGKLRHSVFFFVARGDYGRRLGYRGVYPPATERTE